MNCWRRSRASRRAAATSNKTRPSSRSRPQRTGASWPEQALELARRTRDLRVAVLLARSAGRVRGVAGYASGIALVAGLLERHWQHVYPQLDVDDSGDPTMRLNALAPLADPAPGSPISAAPPSARCAKASRCASSSWPGAGRTAAGRDRASARRRRAGVARRWTAPCRRCWPRCVACMPTCNASRRSCPRASARRSGPDLRRCCDDALPPRRGAGGRWAGRRCRRRIVERPPAAPRAGASAVRAGRAACARRRLRMDRTQ